MKYKEELLVNEIIEIDDTITSFEDLLEYILKLGYVTGDTTVVELMKFLSNIKINYLPLQDEILELIQKSKMKKLL